MADTVKTFAQWGQTRREWMRSAFVVMVALAGVGADVDRTHTAASLLMWWANGSGQTTLFFLQ